MMLWLAVISAAVFLYQLWRYYTDVWRNWPPGPTPLPLLGNLHQLNFRDLTDSFTKFSRTYGPVFRLSFPQHTIAVTDHRLIRQALTTTGSS